MVEVLCKNPYRQTQFFYEGGQFIGGACGPNAVADGASSALGRIISTQAAYDLGVKYGLCDGSNKPQPGASVIGGLRQLAIDLGASIAAYMSFRDPGTNRWTDYAGWIQAQLYAGNAVICEFAYGQALVDVLTGLGPNDGSTLFFHYATFMGRNLGGASSLTKLQLIPGWWLADGCNWAGGNSYANGFRASNQLQYYTDGSIAKAIPCAAIALVGRGVQSMAWTQTASGGKDDKGHTCGGGLMAELTAIGQTAVDGLMSEVRLADGSTMLALENGNVLTDVGGAHYSGQGGVVAVKLYGMYEASQTALAAAEKAASTPPAPTPVTTPPALDAGQVADLAAMAAIRGALFPKSNVIAPAVRELGSVN